MGNRAVIIQYGSDAAIYLHWNGGRDTIEPVLFYAKHFASKYAGFQKMRALDVFAFVCDCIGLNPYITVKDRADCDNGDNGVYYIGKDYKIQSRAFARNPEQHYHDFSGFLTAIDSCMPTKKQLGEEHLKIQVATIKMLEKATEEGEKHHK